MRRTWDWWIDWRNWTIGVELPIGREFLICLGPLLIARMSEYRGDE